MRWSLGELEEEILTLCKNSYGFGLGWRVGRLSSVRDGAIDCQQCSIQLSSTIRRNQVELIMSVHGNLRGRQL